MEKETSINSLDMEELKEIPRWAQRYAENRTAPLIIFSLVFLILFGAVTFSVYSFLKGWIIVAVFMMILYIAGLLYFIVTSDKYEGHYYTKTGIPQSRSVQKIRSFLPLPLILFVVISVIMEQRGVFPTALRVPISAVYICPLLVFANWRWVRGSFIGYLWAALYGLWAVAILFKVPILTFSENGFLRPGGEMFLAVPITGVLTGLTAFVYSRYALKKLKTTAHLRESNNEQ